MTPAHRNATPHVAVSIDGLTVLLKVAVASCVVTLVRRSELRQQLANSATRTAKEIPQRQRRGKVRDGKFKENERRTARMIVEGEPPLEFGVIKQLYNYTQRLPRSQRPTPWFPATVCQVAKPSY